MNGHAVSKSSSGFEESILLLDEKSLSDIESEAGRAVIESRFSTHEWARTARTARTAMLGLRPMSWSTSIRRAGFFFLPSFVQSRISRDWRFRPDRLGPTGYLDGMRGLAAFFVFFCHYFYTCFVIAEGWGANGGNYNVMKLPFLRLLYAGPPMVCVFFVISGYALSLKPLKLARERSWDGFTTTMTSFVFRRAIRLFAPTAISTFLVVVLLRIGAYDATKDVAYDKKFLKNVQELHAAEPLATFWDQLADWGWNMFDFVHVWGWERFGGSTSYDVHLWTIPVEFRASMMLFLTLIGGARLRPGLRLLFLGGIMWFAYRSDRWEMVLFYFGMVFAELDLIRGAHTDPATTAVLPVANNTNRAEPAALTIGGEEADSAATGSRQNGRMRSTGWAVLSVAALYLMSQPDTGSQNTPGWVFLSSLIPEWFSDKYRYWQCVGSILFVWSVGHMPPWQRVFNAPVVQYLGKISYAIYLMHGPMLHTVGYSIMRWAWGVTGVEGVNYNLGFCLAAVFVVPSVVWASDVFWRAVDAPVVRLAKWFEQKCSVQE